EQLEGHVLDLEQRPPAERERRRDPVRGPWPGALRQHRVHAGIRHGRRTCVHDSTSPFALAAWPVSAKNTSSRLGCPTVNSAMETPAVASAASASATRASFGAWADSV